VPGVVQPSPRRMVPCGSASGAAGDGADRHRCYGPRVAALARASRQSGHPLLGGRVLAGHRADIPQMYLYRTFNGPRLASPVVAASGAGHDDPTRLRRPAAPGRWRTTTVRIESACQPRSATTAEPITDDSSTARLLPATIALRNRIGRGPCGWSRPIGPTDRPPTSDRRASRERARPQNRDKPGT
jgi:hypothetical protein